MKIVMFNGYRIRCWKIAGYIRKHYHYKWNIRYRGYTISVGRLTPYAFRKLLKLVTYPPWKIEVIRKFQ